MRFSLVVCFFALIILCSKCVDSNQHNDLRNNRVKRGVNDQLNFSIALQKKKDKEPVYYQIPIIKQYGQQYKNAEEVSTNWGLFGFMIAMTLMILFIVGLFIYSMSVTSEGRSVRESYEQKNRHN